MPAVFSAAQPQTIEVKGDRLSGFVLPVEPVTGDITLRANRAGAWTIDDTKRLWLSGDVEIRIAQFTFVSDEAAVWINRIPSAEGVINQIVVYFDVVTDPVRTAGMGATGSRLLVTGSTRGESTMRVSVMREGRVADRPIIDRGERRLAEYLRTLIEPPLPSLQRHPRIDRRDERAALPELIPGGPPPVEHAPLPGEVELPPIDAPGVALFHPTGLIHLNAGSVEVITGEDENVILIEGSVVVDYYEERAGAEPSRLTLAAQRGVIFTVPGAISEIPSMALGADSVLGIYLEGNVVATDGEYTVRGGRVYYDMLRQQAIVLDGVLRTYSRQLSRTVYARAGEFRQLSRTQWEAKRATVSTSEFFTPHLAIGAREVTLTQGPRGGDDGAEVVSHIAASGNTVQVGGVPVLWFPYFAGEIDRIPIRSASMSVEDNNGLVIETRWDLFALLGYEPPRGLDLEMALDGFSKRGFGGGLKLDYDFNNLDGIVELYGQYDNGIDKTSTGREVDSDKTFRGLALWEQQWRLGENLTLQTQASFISDKTYITTWRESDFQDRREYETSAYLRNIDAHTAWTALVKYDFDDFLSNSFLLASRQRTVDRVPEFTYRRYGDSLFNDTITYSSEFRYSRLRFSFEEHSPDELGIRARGFGISRLDEFDDLLRARGLDQQWVNRFDTRHEVAMPFDAGMFRLRPFVVGRFTAYDREFDEFSSDTDKMRFFGAAGVTVSTSFQRVYNGVENRFFDLHRVRHIIEPSMTVWFAHTTLDQSDIPVFDEDVESLASGSAVRFGLRNTFQTYRGGAGFWHNVDFLKIDTGIVLASGNHDREYPVPQYFDFRPEYSNMVDHAYASFVWLFSDTLTFVGEATYDMDDSRIARGSIGALLQHSPVFTTFVEYRYLDADDTRLLAVAWNYQLTPKYSVSVRPQWDFSRDRFRALRVDFVRSFPDFDLVFGVRHDDIRRDTAFSANVRFRTF